MSGTAGTARPARASTRYAWFVLLLAGWALLGVELVSRANNLGLVEDIAFSPYHIPGYAALLTLVIFVLASISRAGAGRGAWRRAFPRNYLGVPIGTAVIASWILLDVVWRWAFGIGYGIEGSLAPTRLLLPVGLALIASGPLLDALQDRPGDGMSPGAPARPDARNLAGVISLGIVAASATAFLGFHPADSVWSERAVDPIQDASEIWVMAANGSGQTRLLPASGDGIDYSLPVWSPDGSRIAFTQWKNLSGAAFNANPGGQVAAVWTMAADGSDLTLVADTDADAGWNWVPAWSPDGAWIMYTFTPLHSTGDASNAGGPPAPVPNAPPAGPLAAPQAPPAADLWIVHPDGSGRTRVTSAAGDDIAAVWSPDGTKIAFIGQRDGNDGIYLADIDGNTLSNERRLTDDSSDRAPAWSPDGARIAFESSRSGTADIWVINIDGTGLTQITSDSAWDWVPAWSPDGRRIAFTSDRENDVDVWSMASDGSDMQNLTHSPSRSDGQWSVAWSPDGSRIAYASAAYPPVLSSPIVREDLAAAGMLLQGFLLAVAALVLVRIRRPFGSFAILLDDDGRPRCDPGVGRVAVRPPGRHHGPGRRRPGDRGTGPLPGSCRGRGPARRVDPGRGPDPRHRWGSRMVHDAPRRGGPVLCDRRLGAWRDR